jgi:Luciferase
MTRRFRPGIPQPGGRVEKTRIMANSAIADRIEGELRSWPGVTAVPHRFGGVEFRLGRRELGHLHGSRLADLPFPVKVRERLVREGQASRHHILPESGWVSRYIRGEQDVAPVIALFRLNYERPWRTERPASAV